MPVIPATIVSVTDGDTAKVIARPWRGWSVETNVRIFGIDTPEKGFRAKSKAEAALGKKATAFAKEQFPPGTNVRLSGILDDKFGGRILASVKRDDGGDWAELMIAAGLARAYDGGTKASW